MIKHYWKSITAGFILILMPVIVRLCFWNQLPDVIDTTYIRWIDPENSCSKGWFVFGMPMCMLALQCALLAVYEFCNRYELNHKGIQFSPLLSRTLIWCIPVVVLAVENLSWPFPGFTWNGGFLIILCIALTLLFAAIVVAESVKMENNN